MPPKEPSKHQLSNRLQFQSRTPNFLRAFQAKVSGFGEERDEDEPLYENGEEYGGLIDEFGREKRAAVDEFGREIRGEESSERERDTNRRTKEDDDNDNDEEKPVVVVLKEGKHLTEREAENERRKGESTSLIHLRIDNLITLIQREDSHLCLKRNRHLGIMKRKTRQIGSMSNPVHRRLTTPLCRNLPYRLGLRWVGHQRGRLL
jgi:hypothetical protein